MLTTLEFTRATSAATSGVPVECGGDESGGDEEETTVGAASKPCAKVSLNPARLQPATLDNVSQAAMTTRALFILHLPSRQGRTAVQLGWAWNGAAAPRSHSAIPTPSP